MTEVQLPVNVLTPRMLQLMKEPTTANMGLTIDLILKTGDKVTGIFKGLVPDPLARYDYKDCLFVVSELLAKDHDIMYTPINQIVNIMWSYEYEGAKND